MKIVFRVDASLQIGSGHVMRCLTLADALSKKGDECSFICRDHQGNLIDLVREKGYFTSVLTCQSDFAARSQQHLGYFDKPVLDHAGWLGCSQKGDAIDCLDYLEKVQPDWLVVDHYALDKRWEAMLRPFCGKIMVIDDLADRMHECDLLLDQTFRRRPIDYILRVPRDCQLLCGSNYALLRPEFLSWRSYSLGRRSAPQLRRVLITLGGVDKDNVTGRILSALNVGVLPGDSRITVIMGGKAPWLDDVRQRASDMVCRTEVLVGVSNMAELMANSDLAIGAAGATSWERCCLGLPSLMVVLADNQLFAAELLKEAGAALTLPVDETLPTNLNRVLVELSQKKTASQGARR